MSSPLPARMRTLDDIDPAGKRVLLRGDLNLPLHEGRVTDRTRADRLALTIQELCAKGARVVVMSHFGRPKGKPDPDLSLRQIVDAFGAALGGRAVVFAEDCIGEIAERAVAGLGDGEVALLENLRFHPGEESNDSEFAAALARLGDIYVNDAFAAAHRAHASIAAIAGLLPAVAGRLMQAEIGALTTVLDSPARPVAAFVGGAKVSTKLDLIGNLVPRMDALVVGGGMANTFLYAGGVEVGKSLCERDMVDTARDIMAAARAAGCDVLLPEDAVIAAELAEGAVAETVAIGEVPADRMILDIGPVTVASLRRRLSDWRTLLWNGPFGAFEVAPFDAGTRAVAAAAAAETRAGRLVSVAGGGDTLAALAQAGAIGDFTYVSTAGGAFLEWLEGKTLPGVAALERSAAGATIRPPA